MLKRYKAFLFDMDGTLVDSEPLKGEALAQTCADFGGAVTSDAYKRIMGESIESVAKHFFKVAHIDPDIRLFLERFKETYLRILSGNATLIDGVDDFIVKLSQYTVKIGLVSSAYRWMVMNVLSQIGLENKFDIIITQEDVQRHKPDPQAYSLAVVKLDVKAGETLVFEDSTAGITAAKRAGCDIVAVIHEFNQEHDFSDSLLQINNYHTLLKRLA